MRRLKSGERRALERFLSSMGLSLEEVAANPMALEVPGARYVELFDVPEWALEVLELLPSHYAAGLYLGYVEKGRFKPGLPLARRLSELCGERVKCIVVNEAGEKRFLYGRTLRERHLVEWARGVAVVVNARGEPLGWARGVEKSGERMATPIRDLGWYLRRGG
ncbi:MAG: hypothetical protein QXS85_04325 [Acidilobaceae archaeon]